MKHPLLWVLLLPALLVPSLSNAFTPVHLWSQRFGDTSVDFATGVAIADNGDVYLTGYFNGTVDFGGGNLVSAGGSDIFIAKYDRTGVHLWSKRFGGSGTDEGKAIGVDRFGNVYLTGDFNNSVNFGGSTLLASTLADVFLVKFDPLGTHLWSKSFAGSANEFPRAIAVTGPGDVVITGSFPGTINFGGATLGTAGGEDIFLAGFTSSGAHVFSQRYGASGYDVGNGVDVDGSGNIVLTGGFAGTVNFGGGNLVGSGFSEVFLAKYNSAGTHLWSERFGSAGAESAFGVAVDVSGNIAITGYFNGTCSFGGSNLTSVGDYDVFLAKYNFSGVHQWSRSFGDTGDDEGQAVAVDATGDVFLAGHFVGSVSFGGDTQVSSATQDIFLARYDPAGVHQWSTHLGGPDYDNAYAIAAGPSNELVNAGMFNSAMNVGGRTMVSAGAQDAYVVKYSGATAEPVISSITDIGNDQGRKVKIVFSRSGGDDAAASLPVTHYVAMRRTDPPPGASSRGPVALDAGWTEVGSVGAFAQNEYSIDAPTIGDSTIALGPYNSTFFIRAATGEPGVFYDSAPASGYSLDNLAPGIPGMFAYTTGNLTWNESSAEDFDYFTVYGSNADNFAAATLVNYTVGTNMNVSGSPYVYYYLTATDFSGNEGKPAKVNTLSTVGGIPQSYVLSVTNYPNPFNPRTTVKYTVPSRGMVDIQIYDASGAHVVTVFHGERSAGAYSVEWDGHASGGTSVGSGIYFVQISHGGVTQTRKMTLLK